VTTGRWSVLRAYLLAVTILGIPLLALSVARVPWSQIPSPTFPTIVVAAAFLILGELRPIPVTRGADAGDELSISTTIAVALLFLTAPGVACFAQALALFIDECRERRAWDRLAFNIGQYTLALLATRAVYSAVLGTSVFGLPGRFEPHDLAVALLAAIAFFVVNNGLTGVAVALAIRMPMRRLLHADLRSHLPTDGVLLALAPVVTQALAW
jgi:hypothetical protein